MPLDVDDVVATRTGRGVAVGFGFGVEITAGTAAPGASGASCGGAGAELSTSENTLALPLGGSTPATTVTGLVGPIPMEATFLVELERPALAVAKVTPPSVERMRSPPVLPPASAPA